MTEAADLRFKISDALGEVSGFLLRPPDAWLLYVIAHGAGAGMRHRFLESVSASLAAQGIATFRFQFPYIEAGRRRPDPPAILEETVRAAVKRVEDIVPELPVIAGGKSLGGRMTSSAAAREPLPRVQGLVFLGFPLHPPGEPATGRADHLLQVSVPMLFLQGTRDAFARLDLITQVSAGLGSRAVLHTVEGADHSFGVPRRSGRTGADIIAELSSTIATWGRRLVSQRERV